MTVRTFIGLMSISEEAGTRQAAVRHQPGEKSGKAAGSAVRISTT